MKLMETFPYAGLPAHQNWRSAVTAVDDRTTLDPQGPVKFHLSPTAKIASAGSCFAQRLASRLRELGLGYTVAEPGGEPYSARYGNVYTSLQLVQLIERALGRFDPLERAWAAPGGFIDPFRPGIADGTFGTVEALEADRRRHLAAVRELFSAIDVFLFTLGLTELWTDRRDGAAFPICPGRGRGEFDPDRHVFRDLDVAAVTADLERFIAIFREVNPDGQVILTVSPVPIAATMLPMHVVRASVRSKSVLKVAAEAVAAGHPHVDYFASYDLVVQNLGGERLFESGERQPTEAIADRVVRFFVHDYFGRMLESPHAAAPSAAPGNGTSAGAAFCDEDVLLELLAADDLRRAQQPKSSALPTARNGAVEQIAQPIPLYFIGDSNSLVFKDRVFAVPGSSMPFLGRTLHTPGLGGFDLCDSEGRINGNLLSVLVAEHLLIADKQGGWTAYARDVNPNLNYIADIEGRVRRHPPIVLFAGVFDWLQFFEEIEAREIALPPAIMQIRTPLADPSRALDFDTAVTAAARYLEPLERGLRVLRSYGLRNLCLHSLQPGTVDDEAFAHAFFPSSAAARYRAMNLMNHLLHQMCAQTGTTFIDIWSQVTDRDGFVDSRYCFDPVHLNLDAALITVKVLVDHLQTAAEEDAGAPDEGTGIATEDPSTMPAADIVNAAELRLGEGWYPVERDGGEMFRWAGDDAMLYVPVFTAADHRLTIELEPGPGVGSQPFSLAVYDRSDRPWKTYAVRGRQTVELTLPASLPTMHWLRLHVADGGQRIAGDDRVLDYRAFRITVEPLRIDVVSMVDGFRAVGGWYPLEEFGGSTFRWVNNDASIEVSSPATELALEVEPGPGVGNQTFTLKAIGPDGAGLAEFVVAARQRIAIPLPSAAATPYIVKLRVEGGGRMTLGDSRTLNFRVFQAR